MIDKSFVHTTQEKFEKAAFFLLGHETKLGFTQPSFTRPFNVDIFYTVFTLVGYNFLKTSILISVKKKNEEYYVAK